MTSSAGVVVEQVYRTDWGKVVARLVKLTGDFELAEESAQEAFATALESWPSGGIPDTPIAWIIRTACNKAIDRIRRQAIYSEKLESYTATGLFRSADEPEYDLGEIPDDRLRLIFTCCHPAIALEAQVALTLRTLCGLETDEIARAFLVPTATMAQRLVRAKRKIQLAGIPYIVPDVREMPERLDAVLTAIYLVFNEGYAATRGNTLVRTDLCGEAIRLAKLVRTLMAPGVPAEATGLLALMLLHDQNRALWSSRQIDEALPLVQEAMRGEPGPFALQAAIAAVHCRSVRVQETDWHEILRLYDRLESMHPSPVVKLNRAVAVAMAEGLREALALIEELTANSDLEHYHLLHAARADLLRRLGSSAEAAKSYKRALELVTNDSERRYLERRLRETDPDYRR